PDSATVSAAARRVNEAGIDTSVENETCCFAVQDKAWTADPDGLRWELYTVLEDVDTSAEAEDPSNASGCCTPEQAQDGSTTPVTATS
ncbi:MAG: glyoxalase/bleomycin resistance/dioxygenase family protein, partial [Actinomycetota bacterium]